jgi:hypothetical protein
MIGSVLRVQDQLNVILSSYSQLKARREVPESEPLNLLTAAAHLAAEAFNSCSGLASMPASQRSHQTRHPSQCAAHV